MLAQGAARHWIDKTTGVKDLDVWSFFTLPPGVAAFPGTRRAMHPDFGPSALGRQTYDIDAVTDLGAGSNQAVACL